MKKMSREGDRARFEKQQVGDSIMGQEGHAGAD